VVLAFLLACDGRPLQCELSEVRPTVGGEAVTWLAPSGELVLVSPYASGIRDPSGTWRQDPFGPPFGSSYSDFPGAFLLDGTSLDDVWAISDWGVFFRTPTGWEQLPQPDFGFGLLELRWMIVREPGRPLVVGRDLYYGGSELVVEWNGSQWEDRPDLVVPNGLVVDFLPDGRAIGWADGAVLIQDATSWRTLIDAEPVSVSVAPDGTIAILVEPEDGGFDARLYVGDDQRVEPVEVAGGPWATVLAGSADDVWLGSWDGDTLARVGGPRRTLDGAAMGRLVGDEQGVWAFGTDPRRSLLVRGTRSGITVERDHLGLDALAAAAVDDVTGRVYAASRNGLAELRDGEWIAVPTFDGTQSGSHPVDLAVTDGRAAVAHHLLWVIESDGVTSSYLPDGRIVTVEASEGVLFAGGRTESGPLLLEHAGDGWHVVEAPETVDPSTPAGQERSEFTPWIADLWVDDAEHLVAMVRDRYDAPARVWERSDGIWTAAGIEADHVVRTRRGELVSVLDGRLDAGPALPSDDEVLQIAPLRDGSVLATTLGDTQPGWPPVESFGLHQRDGDGVWSTLIQSNTLPLHRETEGPGQLSTDGLTTVTLAGLDRALVHRCRRGRRPVREEE